MTCQISSAVKGLGRCALVVCALSVLTVALPAATHAYPGANGRIAYESNQGGADSEIMNGAIDGSGSVQLTNNTVDDKDPAWSPDGKKIAFARLNAGTGRFEIWTMNADGSGQTAVVTNATRNLTYPTWKPDGAKIAFVQEFSSTDHDLYQADSTGLNSNVASIVLSAADDKYPAWSPVDPNKIVYASRPAGSNFQLRTITLAPLGDTLTYAVAGHDLIEPAWAPDSQCSIPGGGGQTGPCLWILFTRDDPDGPVLHELDPDGSATPLNTLARNAAWAPEGNMLVAETTYFGSTADILLADAPFQAACCGAFRMEMRDATQDRNPDWQPITTAQVRPKGATPLYTPLTIAMKPCTSPNATHDAPFSHPTCTPALPLSKNLTVGEPLVNGKASNFVGSLRLASVPGDAQVDISLKDVRCARFLSLSSPAAYGTCAGGPLSDYTNYLGLQLELQITDRASGGRAGTLQPSEVTFPAYISPSGFIPCTATADTTIGSTCSVSTTLNAWIPGLIVAGKRASWEFQGAKVLDGDHADTAQGQTFAVPGTFHP